MSEQVIFKSFPFMTKAAINRKERLVTGIITTNAVDHVGDVVEPEGLDINSMFARGVVYFNHDRNKPAGLCRTLSRDGNGYKAVTAISKSSYGEDSLVLAEEGIIGGLSIGFIPMESRRPTEEDMRKYGPNCKRVINQGVLLEYSLVIDPCNPEAVLAKANALIKSARVNASSVHYAGIDLKAKPKKIITIDEEAKPVRPIIYVD
jgi:phage head maturation protease